MRTTTKILVILEVGFLAVTLKEEGVAVESEERVSW